MPPPTMPDEDLAAWLRLTLTPGIGNGAARRLLAAFGWPTAIFAQSATALRQVVSNAQASALLTEPPDFATRLQVLQAWLTTAPGADFNPDGQAPTVSRALIPLGDARYPASLLTIEDPPVLLYLTGRLDLLDTHGWPARSLAMVGARNPTPQGSQNARDFARAFAQDGVCVISGLALGIDGAAHEGALAALETPPPPTTPPPATRQRRPPCSRWPWSAPALTAYTRASTATWPIALRRAG